MYLNMPPVFPLLSLLGLEILLPRPVVHLSTTLLLFKFPINLKHL